MRPHKGHHFPQIHEVCGTLVVHSDSPWPKLDAVGIWHVLTHNLLYPLPHANPQAPAALPCPRLDCWHSSTSNGEYSCKTRRLAKLLQTGPWPPTDWPPRTLQKTSALQSSIKLHLFCLLWLPELAFGDGSFCSVWVLFFFLLLNGVIFKTIFVDRTSPALLQPSISADQV